MPECSSAAAVILAGGQGTRLWPLSRARKPKQFQTLRGGESLLQSTVERVAQHVPRDRIYVSTTSALRDAVLDAGCGFDAAHVIEEAAPAGPATAFALGMARVQRDLGDVPTLVCPSDHYFTSRDAVHGALDRMFAQDVTENARPVVLGMRADGPNTRLGYFRVGPEAAQGSDVALDVLEIREKPTEEEAQALVDEGTWYWNTASYLARPSTSLAAYRVSQPDVVQAITRQAASDSPYDGPPVPGHEMEPFFAAGTLPRLIPLAEGWSDVGHWESFLAAEKTAPTQPTGSLLELASTDVEVFNETQKYVVTAGLEDVVIVMHDDVCFVLHRDVVTEPQALERVRRHVQERGLDQLL